MSVTQTYLSQKLHYIFPTPDCQVTKVPPSCLHGLHAPANAPLMRQPSSHRLPGTMSQASQPAQPETEWDAACNKFVIIPPSPPTPTTADSILPCCFALGERPYLPLRGPLTLGNLLRWQWGTFLLKLSRFQISHWNIAHKFSSIL